MQAEAKAAEASAQAQDYYHKLQNSWTPHWLQQKWSQGGAWASRTLLSDKTGKQNSLGQYVTLARVKLLAFWNAATVGEHTPILIVAVQDRCVNVTTHGAAGWLL